MGLTWNSDGSRIIYSSRPGGQDSLWSILASGGEPERFPIGEGGIHPSVSLQGDRLVYARTFFDSNIWRVELRGLEGNTN